MNLTRLSIQTYSKTERDRPPGVSWLFLPIALVIVFAIIGFMVPTVLGKPPSQTSANPASVDDLLKAKFKRVAGRAYRGAALDTGNPESWFSHYVMNPTVSFDGIRYRMWFVGGSKTKNSGVPYGHYERIGLAESDDGVSWRVANGGKPVFDLGPPGSADAKGLSQPCVLKVEEKYMMWYVGIDGKQARDLGLKPGHVRLERICLATSSDGIHWKRENGGQPVLDIGPKSSVLRNN